MILTVENIQRAMLKVYEDNNPKMLCLSPANFQMFMDSQIWQSYSGFTTREPVAQFKKAKVVSDKAIEDNYIGWGPALCSRPCEKQAFAIFTHNEQLQRLISDAVKNA